MKHFFPAIVATGLLLLTACSGTVSHQVEAMQNKDKHLTCKEMLLERNEANFYKKAALKNKRMSVGSIIMPIGYLSTYKDAENAIEAADARIAYLNKIYDIMHCADYEKKQKSIQHVRGPQMPSLRDRLEQARNMEMQVMYPSTSYNPYQSF